MMSDTLGVGWLVHASCCVGLGMLTAQADLHTNCAWLHSMYSMCCKSAVCISASTVRHRPSALAASMACTRAQTRLQDPPTPEKLIMLVGLLGKGTHLDNSDAPEQDAMYSFGVRQAFHKVGDAQAPRSLCARSMWRACTATGSESACRQLWHDCVAFCSLQCGTSLYHACVLHLCFAHRLHTYQRPLACTHEET